MNLHRSHFLRRTLFAASSLAALALAVPTQAQTVQTVTLMQGTSQLATCTLNGAITVTPNGGLSIPCSGTVSNPNPTPNPNPSPNAVFAVNAPISINTGATSTTTTVTRTGGTNASHWFVYQVSGAGCAADANTIQITTDGGTAQIPLTPIAAGLTCSLQIFPTELGDTANPSTIVTINVVSAAPVPSGIVGPINGTVVPAGCPTPAQNWTDPNVAAGGSPLQLRMTSGQVASFKVVSPNDPLLQLVAGQAEATFTQGQQPASPTGVVTEMQVSKCPGTIDLTSGTIPPACYYKSVKDQLQTNNMGVILRSEPGFENQANTGNVACWIADAPQQYFVNVRWTYTSCQWTAQGGCGFSMQWQSGPN